MNLLKEILRQEVYPAVGCTEPIACAYCAAEAAVRMPEPFHSLKLTVDPATYKNGACITVPNSGGRKGNLVGAVLGAFVARPDAKLEVLNFATPEIVEKAHQFLSSAETSYTCRREIGLAVEVTLAGAHHSVRCLIQAGHTHIQEIEIDGRIEFQAAPVTHPESALAYRAELRNMSLAELLTQVTQPDDDDLEYLRQGVTMNRSMAEQGKDIPGTAFQLRHMAEKGFVTSDLFYRAKLLTASAVDARMSGLASPVMTSGGSGNQGIVAILLPWIVGQEAGLSETQILRSIAVSHAMNAYVKCFMGELAAICNCAMSAGIGAAAAIVFQRNGVDMSRITMAVNNVIGDLGGLICDGAKPGCALKVITSVDSALRSAFMALEGYGLSAETGVLGGTVEESIQHLARLTLEGMTAVDPTVLNIMERRDAPLRTKPGAVSD